MRVAVMGSSGSGKSTFARRLGAALGAPHTELDALNWRPGWTDLSKTDPDEFVRQVEAVVAADAWVIDGNYNVVRPAILRRATHLVWLDYERSVIMPRVIHRSFLRAISKDELWPGTGNREEFRNWLKKDHPIRWAWDTFKRRREGYGQMFADPRLQRLSLHRLRHPREAEPLIARLKAEALPL
jgi:adenylate kinase family enzyme